MNPAHVDVEDLVANLRLRWPHVLIIALLAAAITIDGYDIFMVAYILPALSLGLKVSPASLTQVLVLQQFGLLLGTLVVGPLVDRFGRRRSLLVVLPIFGVLTISTSLVRTLLQLDVMRFVAALFFSAVLPTTIAMAAEFAPRKYRSGVVTVVFCGYTGGNLVAASVLKWALPLGWQAAFWIGGLLPLVLLPFMAIWLPESVQFRALRNPSDPSIAKTLTWLDRSRRFQSGERYVVRQSKKPAKLPVVELFREGRTMTAVLLWLAFLGTGIFTYITVSWATTLLHLTRHMPMPRVAALMGAAAIAGIIGTAISGFVMDRFGARLILPIYLVGAAISIVVIALMNLNSPWTPVAFACLGFFYYSGWGGLNAVCSIIYPAEIRATGVAWAIGAAKVGAMIGPAIGGLLIAQKWDLTPIFLIAAIPEFCAAAAVVFLLARRKKQSADEAALA